jgi:hypothetical protein
LPSTFSVTPVAQGEAVLGRLGTYYLVGLLTFSRLPPALAYTLLYVVGAALGAGDLENRLDRFSQRLSLPIMELRVISAAPRDSEEVDTNY